jgi:hypothetical protein
LALGPLRDIAGFGGRLFLRNFATNALDPRFARKVGGVHSTIVSARCGCTQRLTHVHTRVGDSRWRETDNA